MLIVADARPGPDRNFDGKISIWRVCLLKTARCSSKKYVKGEEYDFDVTIDAEWYAVWYIQKLLPAIKKISWLKGRLTVVQQDGVRPHKGTGNPERFSAAGQSPDFNANDLCFFNITQ